MEELSGDAKRWIGYQRHYLKMKFQDAKISKLEYYIANVNPQCWLQYKEKRPEHIQSHLLTTREPWL